MGVLNRKWCLNSTQDSSIPFVGDLMTKPIWSSASPFPANVDQTKPSLTTFHNVFLGTLLPEADIGLC